MKKKFFFFCFFAFAAIAPAQNKNVFRISKIDSTGVIALDKFWKFHNGDDSAWATPSFDDSKWDAIKSTFIPFGKNDSNIFKGIAWFRIHIYIDSSLNNTPLCLLIDQDGASQIYLDGKLIHSIGTVSSDLTKEKKYNPHGTPLSFRYGNAGEYLIAVRYSNLNYRQLYKKYNTSDPGFSIKIANQDDSVMNKLKDTISGVSITIGLGIFFFTLGFVHLLFYLFYRKQRTNLYYSGFVVLLGLLFIIPAISINSFDPEQSIKYLHFLLFLFPVFFYSMLLLEYSLFKKEFGKSLVITTAIIIIIGIIIMLLIGKDDYFISFIFSFIIGSVCASFSIVVSAIIRKVNGAWIIGTGSLCFLIFMGIIIISLLIKGEFLLNFSGDGFSANLVLILIMLAIMSIPISMSIYLAREFAQTNKHLEKNLIEVKTLSAKNIEQEKEKQKILETQKEILEIQVEERTSEITEQKKIIEEKNKDITDSINYAKRIQEAILPDKKILAQLFPSAFILFKPKDIVSGDFYWFGEKDSKKIIIAADCTGHGVPGSLMSMIGSNILSHLILEKAITKPNEILNNLHKEIRIALKQNDEKTETRDGMDIAIISIENDMLQYAGAQRPLWIIKNNKLEEIKANKFSIGGIQQEEERIFTNHSLGLEKNDCIYIFSDGYADQFGGDKGKKFMTKNFKQLVLSIHEKPIMEQKEIINNTIEDWRSMSEQVDDILVIGIKI